MLRVARILVLALIAGSTAGLAQASDYERRALEIPMRDGVKLHTLMLVPHGATRAPILLNRTPFNAERRLRLKEEHLAAAVPGVFRGPAEAGYILVFQDVRGKNGSGGDYIVQRPLSGPLNATAVDHSTDAWDTIDWLVKHTPEGNGRVGIMGISYDGFTALSALIHPHPALKAAVPINPMVDGWRGDDWFQNGAFRQLMMSFVYYDAGPPKSGARFATALDDYSASLAAGSAGSFASRAGLDEISFWTTLKTHPADDAFWRGQALDARLAGEPTRVPTLFVASLWDQEDGYGAVHAWSASRARPGPSSDFLLLGPWFHGQVNGNGAETGPLRWPSDTVADFRRDVLQPFLDASLTDGRGPAKLAPVIAYDTGARRWRHAQRWPIAATTRALYLQANGGLAFTPPKSRRAGADRYVSDPANPVPYSPRPNHVVTELDEGWSTWLLEDQRKVSARPDVLTYVTPPLDRPLRIAGAPVANLVASTSGTDSDWVVKLIDVQPDGYELPIAMQVFRGRYRRDPARAFALQPNRPLRYRFDMPAASHTFQPGHRVMVQVQSSWFPLIDRNPQTFVSNIFEAKPGDYRPATQRVFHTPAAASEVELPIAPD